MIIRHDTHDADSHTIEEWDNGTDLYTRTVDGTQVEQRSLTTEESADMDAAEPTVVAQENQTTLTDRIAESIDVLLATVENLNAITAISNSTMNANPAAYIKDVAREVKTVARQTIDIARVVSGTLDSTENGS